MTSSACDADRAGRQNTGAGRAIGAIYW